MTKKESKNNTLTREEVIAQNKEQILKALLEDGESTRAEIALKTGLSREYGPWASLKDPLDGLIAEKLVEKCTTKGCEERRLKRDREFERKKKKIRDDPNVKRKFNPPKKRGTHPPVWIIKKDISTIHMIFNKYQNLQELLWNIEWVRELVIKKQLDTRQLGEEDIQELKGMLLLSRHFFKMCVNYKDLYGLTIEWMAYFDHESERTPKEIAKRLKDYPDLDLASMTAYRNLFAFCYFVDESNDVAIDKGYEIVARHYRERSQKMKKSRQIENLSVIENVMIPILKMFFDNISDKSFGTLNSKIPDVLEKIRPSVQQYTALNKQIKSIRKDPDFDQKVGPFYDGKRKIVVDILDTLAGIGIIKKIR